MENGNSTHPPISCLQPVLSTGSRNAAVLSPELIMFCYGVLSPICVLLAAIHCKVLWILIVLFYVAGHNISRQYGKNINCLAYK